MAYDLTDHPLLSPAAAALEPADLAAWSNAAQFALGFGVRTWTGEALTAATNAVALTVSLSVAQASAGASGGGLKVDQKGDQRKEYFGAGASGNAAIVIPPLAARIAEQLLRKVRPGITELEAVW